MGRRIGTSGVGVILAMIAIVLLAGAGTASAGSSSAFSCGVVKKEPIRAVKGVADRQTCRTLAKVALTRFKFKPACGQWQTGEPDCMAGGWYCSIPAAEVQEQQNLIAYCYDPKPGQPPAHEEWVPTKWQGLFEIGGRAATDAGADRGLLPELRRRLPCHSAVQTLSMLHGISCAGAVRVVEAAYAQVHPHLPECPSDKARKFAGWQLIAHPGAGEPGHPTIGTRFIKGRKSFLASGGGLC